MIPPLPKKKDCEYINQKENDNWEDLRHADKICFIKQAGIFVCQRNGPEKSHVNRNHAS
jgi:hypothetical protein